MKHRAPEDTAVCNKKIIGGIEESRIAVELINLGARMQVLETETSLSRRWLLKLYKEIKGCSPSKGMLPFSPEWYMSWEQNIHSSIFYNIFCYLKKKLAPGNRNVEIMIKSYKLYLENVLSSCDGEQVAVLTLTRAWTLLRFMDCGMIKFTRCESCGGSFVIVPSFLTKPFVCCLCSPPSRATKKIKA